MADRRTVSVSRLPQSCLAPANTSAVPGTLASTKLHASLRPRCWSGRGAWALGRTSPRGCLCCLKLVALRLPGIPAARGSATPSGATHPSGSGSRIRSLLRPAWPLGGGSSGREPAGARSNFNFTCSAQEYAHRLPEHMSELARLSAILDCLERDDDGKQELQVSWTLWKLTIPLVSSAQRMLVSLRSAHGQARQGRSNCWTSSKPFLLFVERYRGTKGVLRGVRATLPSLCVLAVTRGP